MSSSRRGYLLVVEDDDATRDLYTLVLEDFGHGVEAVGSVEEALVLLERSRPDVVITDMTMPSLSGMDLIRYLRDRYPAPPPPVVAISGFHGYRDEALAAGATRFLAKPIDAQELLDVVQALLVGEAYAEEDYASGRRLRRQTARAMAEAAIAVVLQHDPELEQRIVTVVKWLAHYIGGATTLLLVPHEEEFRVMAVSDELHFLPGTASPGLAALGADVVETHSSLILGDCGCLAPPLHSRSGDWTIGAVVAVPFCVQDAVVGALCLVSAEPRSFGSNEVALMQHLAERAADWTSGRRHRPFLALSGLISRSSFQVLLRLEVDEASRHADEALILAFVRLGSDLESGAGMQILQSVPERRTLIADLGQRKLALAVRGPAACARLAAQRLLRRLGERLPIEASAQLLLGAPVPLSFERPLLDWVSDLLDESERRAPGTMLTIDAVPSAQPIAEAVAGAGAPPGPANPGEEGGLG